MPSLQQQGGENQSQAKIQLGVGVHLLRQHAHGEQQTEGIDGIKAGEASGPKAACGERPTLGALGIVIGEDEAGEQQEEADGNVSAIDHRAQRSKRMRVGKMEEDQIGGGKTADARKGRQLGAAGSRSRSWADQHRTCRGLSLDRLGRSFCGLECGSRGWFRECALGSQAVTREPTFSPLTTRKMFPGRFMLKMIMGKLLSLHRLTAVLSITLRPSRRISI